MLVFIVVEARFYGTNLLRFYTERVSAYNSPTCTHAANSALQKAQHTWLARGMYKGACLVQAPEPAAKQNQIQQGAAAAPPPPLPYRQMSPELRQCH